MTKKISLAEATHDCIYQIVENKQQKYMELGLFKGSKISIFQATNRLLVIAVGASRYIIPRMVAKNILVESIEEKNKSM